MNLVKYGQRMDDRDGVGFLCSIVEVSVANGSLASKLSCPPLPDDVKDLELPMSGSKPHAVVSPGCHHYVCHLY